MASSRITKSVVDITKLASLIQPHEKEAFVAFKQKCDSYSRRLSELPAEKPAINWDNYKGITTPGLVAKFKAEYESVKVDYPKDTYSNSIKDFDKLQKIVLDKIIELAEIKKQNVEIEIGHLKTIPPVMELTRQEIAQYYPKSSMDPENPRFYPYVVDIKDTKMVVEKSAEELRAAYKKMLIG